MTNIAKIAGVKPRLTDTGDQGVAAYNDDTSAIVVLHGRAWNSAAGTAEFAINTRAAIQVYNGSTFAVARGDATNGLDVDVTRVATQAYSAAVTITRPANTTAYTARDVLGGAQEATSMGPSAGRIMITSVSLEADITAVPSGMGAFTLYLYNVTPPSAVADNGAFDIPAGDRASFLGKISLGSLTDEGSTLYVEQNSVQKQLLLSGTSLFFYLVSESGFTPAANSEVYKVTLHAVAL